MLLVTSHQDCCRLPAPAYLTISLVLQAIAGQQGRQPVLITHTGRVVTGQVAVAVPAAQPPGRLLRERVCSSRGGHHSAAHDYLILMQADNQDFVATSSAATTVAPVQHLPHVHISHGQHGVGLRQHKPLYRQEAAAEAPTL
jgi:hypothetical protein